MKDISTMFSIGNIEIKWYSFFLLVAFHLSFLFGRFNNERGLGEVVWCGVVWLFPVSL